MSKFLRLTGISGNDLLVDKSLVVAAVSDWQGNKECRKIVTRNCEKYYVKDSIDVIQTQLEED